MVNEIESSRKIKEVDMNINSWQSVGLCLRERELKFPSFVNPGLCKYKASRMQRHEHHWSCSLLAVLKLYVCVYE